MAGRWRSRLHGIQLRHHHIKTGKELICHLLLSSIMSHGSAFECPFGCNTRKTFRKQSSLNAHMAQCRMRDSGVVKKNGKQELHLPINHPLSSSKHGNLNDVHRGNRFQAEEEHEICSDNSTTEPIQLETITNKHSTSFVGDEDTEEELSTTGLTDRRYEGGFEEYGSFEEHEDDSVMHNTETPLNEDTPNPATVSEIIKAAHSDQFTMEVMRQERTGKIVVYPAAKPKSCRVPSDVALLDLASILDKARCPNYMFDSILSWCKYAGKVGCDLSADRLPTRKAYFSKLEKRLATANMSVPSFYTKKVLLETAKINPDSSSSGFVESEVNYWDFSEQLISLLSDHSIFGDRANLNLNTVNPFLPNRDCKSTGGWYQDTIRAKGITGYDGNFLIGIVLAADRTGNTFNLRFGTEPLLFTLSIINENLWHQSRVWRPLAMIPCDRDSIGQARGNLHSKRNEGMGSSYRNYHAYVQVALESLRRVQSPTYLYWPYNEKGVVPPNAKSVYRGALSNNNVHELCQGLPVKNTVPSNKLRGVLTTLTLGENQRLMNVVCCVSHVILDGAGADKITCRHKGNVEQYNRISRGCDCSFEESDNTFVNCCPVSQARIIQGYHQLKWSKTYMDKDVGHFQKTIVESCAIHPCENAFWTIDFGASPNGMYSGPLTIDSMHAFEEGNNGRILVLLLGEQKSSHRFCARVDNIVDQRLRNASVPRQSSSKRLPRMCFSRGISSLSNLAAHERVGVMCALTLVSISLEAKGNGDIIMGRKLEGCPSEKRTAVMNRVVFCQLALLYHCWVDNGPHDVLFVDNSHRSERAIANQVHIQDAVSLIGEYQKITFPRNQGNGHKTQKFHDWYKHMIPSIVHAGNGRRIKADTSEKMHKYFCKAPGETALKHSQDVFLRGVCSRLTTTSMLNQTRGLLGLGESQMEDDINPQIQFRSLGYKKSVTSFARVQMSDSFATSVLIWNSDTTNQTGYDPFARDMIVHGCHQLKDKQFLPADASVRVYTELSIENTTFRCHPNYRKENGPWFDWAMIKWGCQMKSHWKVAPVLWEPNPGAVNSIASSYQEVLLSLHDHLENSTPFRERPPPTNTEINIYVPARIVAFLECPATETTTPVMYAVLESCQSECYTDSLLTRRWRKTPGTASQRCIVVEVTAIACPCYVLESDPGFPKEGVPDSTASLIVHEVFDRKTSWGQKFLDVVNRGLPTVCYADVRSHLSKLLKSEKRKRNQNVEPQTEPRNHTKKRHRESTTMKGREKESRR